MYLSSLSLLLIYQAEMALAGTALEFMSLLHPLLQQNIMPPLITGFEIRVLGLDLGIIPV